jgi:hypothetical protein
MYVVPGPVRVGHGPGQWRRVVGRAQEHGNGPDWHWALAPESTFCVFFSRVGVVGYSGERVNWGSPRSF